MVDSIAFSGLGYRRQGNHGYPTFAYLNYTLGDITGGGQPIVVTGKNLYGASVLFGDTRVPVNVYANQTRLSFTLPAHESGLVDLVITTPLGSVTVSDAFEYWSPATDAFDYLDSGKHVSEGVAGPLSVCDTYSSTNQNSGRTMRGGAEQTSRVGQSFVGNGEYVSTATFFLKKTGAPSGDMVAQIYTHTGTFGDGTTGKAEDLLATSAVIDCSTLTTLYADTTFTFSGAEQILLEEGVYYVVAVKSENGDGSNNVQVGSDSTGDHEGSSTYYGGAWSRSPNDVCFTVETQVGSGFVTAWTDDAYGDVYEQAVEANQPTHVQNVFGTMPAVRFIPPQSLLGTWQDMGASGMSVFAVAAWTSSDSVVDGDATNVPLTIVGSSLQDGAFGANGGQLEVNFYDGLGAVTHVVDRGSGLNDGVARLVGVTYDITTDVKFYVGTSQQGATDVGTVLGSMGWDTIGAGVAGLDGWNGDLGAVVIYSGVVDPVIHVKLNRWAQQRFGIS